MANVTLQQAREATLRYYYQLIEKLGIRAQTAGLCHLHIGERSFIPFTEIPVEIANNTRFGQLLVNVHTKYQGDAIV